jgi:lysophospholipase L1-like esterase
MARSQGSNRLTVLLGDSISQWFPTDRLSNDRFWLNQSISGDTTAGVLRRLSALNRTNPDTICLMVGINDLRRGTADTTVLHNLQQIIRRLRQSHPQAQIITYSVLPTRSGIVSSDRVQQINLALANITRQEGANFIDLQPIFADAQGQLRRELTTDGLHLNARGYDVWQVAMRSQSPTTAINHGSTEQSFVPQ